jgi:hypothetical protein
VAEELFHFVVSQKRERETKRGPGQDTAPTDLPPVSYFLQLALLLKVAITSQNSTTVCGKSFLGDTFYPNLSSHPSFISLCFLILSSGFHQLLLANELERCLMI